MSKHVMLDLETYGTSMTAPVVCIGAAAFDFGGNTISTTFRACIPLEEAVKDGAIIEAGAVQFWHDQPEEAHKGLHRGRNTIRQALEGFADFLEHEAPGLEGLWGNGAAFDNALLRETYKRAGIECPWSHKVDQCYRTEKLRRPQEFPRRPDLILHDAVHDAKYQALHLMAIRRIDTLHENYYNRREW